MFEKMKLKRDKRKFKKKIEKKKRKLCIKYEMINGARKKYIGDDCEYSKNRLKKLDSELMDVMKGIYYADKDISKLGS